MVKIRDDLKTNPEYLNQVIGSLSGSLELANQRIKELEEKLGGLGTQESLIDLKDQIEMLNKRFFDKGQESLSKKRPPKNYDRELLPHNVPPVELSGDKIPQIEEVEIYHDEAICPSCNSSDLEEMKGQSEDSIEIDLKEKSAIKKNHKRKKFRCKKCEIIVTAKGPPKIRKGSKYSINFRVSAGIDKFNYHLPLERQSRRFEEQGLKIDTKTLFNCTEAIYLNLEPILEKIKEEILRY